MRLVVVSNRLPFTVSFHEGLPQFKPSAGGLTTGLWSYLDAQGAGRRGAPGLPVDGLARREHSARTRGGGARLRREQFKSAPVFLPEESMDRFYLGFCNKTIWPLFHYFPTLTHYEEESWQEYRNVNRVFGEAVVTALRPDDVLWIHDYHLMLLPEAGARKIPGNAHRVFPAHPVSFLGNLPDAAARMARGDRSTGCLVPA